LVVNSNMNVGEPLEREIGKREKSRREGLKKTNKVPETHLPKATRNVKP